MPHSDAFHLHFSHTAVYGCVGFATDFAVIFFIHSFVHSLPTHSQAHPISFADVRPETRVAQFIPSLPLQFAFRDTRRSSSSPPASASHPTSSPFYSSPSMRSAVCSPRLYVKMNVCSSSVGYFGRNTLLVQRCNLNESKLSTHGAIIPHHSLIIGDRISYRVERPIHSI